MTVGGSIAAGYYWLAPIFGLVGTGLFAVALAGLLMTETVGLGQEHLTITRRSLGMERAQSYHLSLIDFVDVHDYPSGLNPLSHMRLSHEERRFGSWLR